MNTSILSHICIAEVEDMLMKLWKQPESSYVYYCHEYSSTYTADGI